MPADLAVICTQKDANTALAAAAGLEIGSTGGIVVDERMATSAPDVWAAGDCIEIPHGVIQRAAPGPVRQPRLRAGQGGRHQRRRRRRRYQPVYVPWGMVAGKWMIGGVSFGETLATALGIPYVVGAARASPAPATTPA